MPLDGRPLRGMRASVEPPTFREIATRIGESVLAVLQESEPPRRGDGLSPVPST
jgi:hypothetical protein